MSLDAEQPKLLTMVACLLNVLMVKCCHKNVCVFFPGFFLINYLTEIWQYIFNTPPTIDLVMGFHHDVVRCYIVKPLSSSELPLPILKTSCSLLLNLLENWIAFSEAVILPTEVIVCQQMENQWYWWTLGIKMLNSQGLNEKSIFIHFFRLTFNCWCFFPTASCSSGRPTMPCSWSAACWRSLSERWVRRNCTYSSLTRRGHQGPVVSGHPTFC